MPPKNKTDLKKLEAERLSGLLQELLREDENKYCADCEAKQPRWASWNLGVFLCIRCAGLHRNLGVHISKVKSINLDIWTPEQVQSMRLMGNAKAKVVYESGLPQMFRRPQNDQALEAFIRAKYETQRYILKDWTPPKVDVNDLPLKAGMEKFNKNNKKPLNDTKIVKQINKPPTNPEPILVNLIDIDEPCPSNNNFNNFETKPIDTNKNSLDDIFGPIVSAPISTTNNNNNNLIDELNNISLIQPNNDLNSTSNDLNKKIEDITNDFCETTINQKNNDLADINFNSVSLTQGDSKKSNSDILALFANGIKQPMTTTTTFNQQKFFQNSPY